MQRRVRPTSTRRPRGSLGARHPARLAHQLTKRPMEPARPALDQPRYAMNVGSVESIASLVFARVQAT